MVQVSKGALPFSAIAPPAVDYPRGDLCFSPLSQETYPEIYQPSSPPWQQAAIYSPLVRVDRHMTTLAKGFRG